MHSIACPACCAAQSGHTPTADLDGFRSWLCGTCGLKFSQPMKAADAHWYEQSPIYQHHGQWLASSTLAPPPRWEFCQVRSDVAPTSVLDIGCGHGEFLHWARTWGFTVTGIDFNPRSLAFARVRYGIEDVHECSPGAMPATFGTRRFGAVTLFEVLEHTEDPFATLQTAAEFVDPGGSLCVSVPGQARWPRLFNASIDKPPHHLTMWTEDALANILQRVGLTVVSVRRKPLHISDLGGHLRWAIHRRHPKSLLRFAEPSAATIAARALHFAGRLSLAPVCAALRLYPHAGGFTIFAHAVKPPQS